MKKYLICILGVALCLFLITGCSNNNDKTYSNDTEENVSEGQKVTSNNSNEDEIELYSDSTKIVFESGQGKIVYYYSGETITKYEAYIDYGDATTAKFALSQLDDDEENVKKKYTKGKYLVIEYAESEYENLTVSDVKLMYSYLKELQKK